MSSNRDSTVGLLTFVVCAVLAAVASTALAQCGGPFKLTASDGAANDWFGGSVAISGDTAVVGAQGDDSYKGSAYVYRWDGSGWVQLARLTASDGVANDYFGSSVAISGDTIVVGASGDDSYEGSAYVFAKPSGGWASMTQTAKLTASDGTADDRFGVSVAISRDTIVVGASAGDVAPNFDQGAAYVFVKPAAGWTNMTQTAVLSASDGGADDRLGTSVAIEGDTILAGAPNDDVGVNTDQGSAYVFGRPPGGWATMTETATLRASDGAVGDALGYSVAIWGGTIVAGSTWAAVNGNTGQGSAYVFVKPGGGWATGVETGKLAASDGAEVDCFGYSVAIWDDTIVVGAILGDIGASADQGSAYVFAKPSGGWATGTETAKLSALAGTWGDEFAYSVAMWRDTIVVGAVYDDVGATTDQGSAHVFHRTGELWVQTERTMVASDGAADDLFGWSVAVSGDTAVVGVPYDDSTRGSAYVFHWEGAGWVQLAKLNASDGVDSDFFGQSVAIWGGTIVVGAPYDEVGTNGWQGSAYVFVKPGGGWADMTETAKLTASDGAADDSFGKSVAISGDSIVVGAYGDDIGVHYDQGSAHVFVKPSGGWVTGTESAKLVVWDGQGWDRLGCSVAASGDTIVVGARGRGVGANGTQGSAHVFLRDGESYHEAAELTSSDGESQDWFGYAVAISGDVIVVGATFGDDLSIEGAYVFVKPGGGWIVDMTETAKLAASDGRPYDAFGDSVAVFGDTIVVGAWDDQIGTMSGRGSGYVFPRPPSGWASDTETSKLTASDGQQYDRLGRSVAIAGDMIVLGAIADDVGGNPDQGSARSFYVGDECLSFVDNVTSGVSYATIADAISHAGSTDEILASSGAFTTGGSIDYRGKALRLDASRGVMMPYNSVIALANNSLLAASAGYPMILFGQLRVPSSATVDMYADELHAGSSAQLTVRSGADLYLDVPRATVDGTLWLDTGVTLSSSGSLITNGRFDVFANSTIWTGDSLELNGRSTLLTANIFTGPLTVRGTVNYSDVIFSASLLTVGGYFTGYGTIYAPVTNNDHMYMVEDTLIVGDLLNNSGAVIKVQIGTTTLMGQLTNNGTIVGDFQYGGEALRGTLPGDGLIIGGDFISGAGSSLVMANPVWRLTVSGNYDNATNSNTRFDMVQAELSLTGGVGQTLEVMSTDIGRDRRGLDRTLPGHYPLGTLHIGSSTVQLVDNHDNDGQGQAACEAVYVDRLEIEAGATLINPSCRVYYDTLVNNGSATNPENLVWLGGSGDFDGDGDMDLDDYGILAECLFGPNRSPSPVPPPTATQCLTAFDFDADADVDLRDFAGFQTAFAGG